jgi:hypothetical protein
MNISSTFNNAATADLCPLPGRRTVKELDVKLFVVHFTTISAFCHLQSLRNERIVSWRTVFYIIVPYSIFVWYGAALLALSCILLCAMYKPMLLGDGGLKRASLWLFGTAPESGVADQGLLPSERPAMAIEGERRPKWMGRLVLASALLVQCIGTIVLYSRRQKHEAVTLADQRVFALGCTGVLVAIHWIVIILKIRPFANPAPRISTHARSKLDDVLLGIRNSELPHLRTRDVEF